LVVDDCSAVPARVDSFPNRDHPHTGLRISPRLRGVSWVPADFSEPDDAVRYRGDPGDLFDAVGELLAVLTRRPVWHAAAACRGQGPDGWFIAKGGRTAPARTICERCPVRRECLNAGCEPDNLADGVWGGLAPQERRTARRGKRATA
jgi:WhiB family redox-sensing transcriptional regulator